MSWQRPTLNIDLSRSYGAYAYDLTTQRHVLDLFGMFSSMPLGYGGRFNNAELGAIVDHAGVKFALGAVDCPAAVRFRETFKRLAHTEAHPHQFFTNTGSQAVEAALKACFEKCAHGVNSQYVAISRSFHGVYGYAASTADDSEAFEYTHESLNSDPWNRVRDLPKTVKCSLIGATAPASLRERLDYLRAMLVTSLIGAVLIEPIMCTAGDIVLDIDFLRGLRRICTDTGTPLVFDEIQTGFGVTGSFWYYEKLGITPDVVVFGKKAQVSGFMSNFEFDARKLASTWQGDVIDMIRCTHVLEEYEREGLLADKAWNVEWRGRVVEQKLRDAGLIVRRVGLLLALDFDTSYARDEWCRRMWDVGVLVNPTGERCVRLRPPLNIDDATITDLAQRLKKADEETRKRAVFAGFAP